jgi:multiple sugar transport system permease protein
VTDNRLKRALGRVALYILLVVFSLLFLAPLFWMISSSLKLDKDVFAFPMRWIPETFQWKNYVAIWQKIPFLTFYKNTALLAVTITVLSVVTCSLTAYAFAKIRFRGRNALFICYLGTIAVPFQIYMIPQFILIKGLHLNDTLLSLILIQSFSAFGVFLFRQFIVSIPEELSESARIDGVGDWGIYRRIIMPLSQPAIATLGVFQFVYVWNNFQEPLVYLTSTKNKTLQLGIRMFITQYTTDFSLIMAATVCSLIPIFLVFVASQRFFIEGIATTGLKG